MAPSVHWTTQGGVRGHTLRDEIAKEGGRVHERVVAAKEFGMYAHNHTYPIVPYLV